MARLNAFLAAAMLAAPALAHFRIEVPNSMVGENQNRQTSGPCGGFTPSDDDEAVDFHVGGDAVAVADGHSRSDWLIRGTLQTDASGGWKQLYDIYQTRGQGRSCQPSVKAPEEWIGERGIISVVGQAEDGTLYGVSCIMFRLLQDSPKLTYLVCCGQLRRGHRKRELRLQERQFHHVDGFRRK